MSDMFDLAIIERINDLKQRVADLTAQESIKLDPATGLPSFTALTTGSVLFAGASGLLSQDNTNLSWDDANNRLTVTGRKFLGSGTSFPASPPTNGEYYRTDLGFLCYYDGTRWLTMQQFEANLQTFALNPLPYSTAAINTLLLTPSRTDYSYYVVRARAYVFINTTNNGSNYWGFELRDDNVASLWGFDTSTVAAGEIFKENASINTAATVSNYLTLTVTTKTGSPGSVGALHCAVWYRLIIT